MDALVDTQSSADDTPYVSPQLDLTGLSMDRLRELRSGDGALAHALRRAETEALSECEEVVAAFDSAL